MLCRECYNTPEILGLYKAMTTGWPKGYEPTEEELEVVIAEQRQCLPDWWEQDEQKMGRGGPIELDD